MDKYADNKVFLVLYNFLDGFINFRNYNPLFHALIFFIS